MRSILIILIIIGLTNSCIPDFQGPWIISEGKRIKLYTRPICYTQYNSPDSSVIIQIIDEQESVIDYINHRINTDFNSKVYIYLFNIDEAKQKIGTYGGSCNSKEKQILFTYWDTCFYNTIRTKNEHIGVHEMVHIIADNELGSSKTRFFSEGYANAIDGNYGIDESDTTVVRKRIELSFKDILINEKQVSPSRLLENPDIIENEYYPQVGMLFKWLFSEYGVDKMNKIYSCEKDQIKKRFYEVTNEKFEDMEKKYLNYINSL